MGIKELSAWVKRTHPEVIQSFPKRWADPAIKGKRVAIDGTLLTNRFHFGGRKDLGRLQEKGGVIGWYHLITAMRTHGVKPIAIWDQRGHREWKAQEARRRLATRSLTLARRNHEDERAERLAGWRAAFQELEEMDEVERELVWGQWDGEVKEKLKELAVPEEEVKTADEAPTPAAEDSVITGSSELASAAAKGAKTLAAAASLPVAAAEMAIERAANLVSAVSSLLDDYKLNNKPFRFGRQVVPPEVSDMIEHVKELEDFSPTPGPARQGKEEEEEESELIDETLQELVPTEHYRESQTQTLLTKREGEIVRGFLAEPAAWVNASGAIGEVEELIEYAPEVRGIYERALHTPTASDHEDCKELLGAMGVPVLEAPIPFEAEGLASQLAAEGLVDFVGTEDSDVLAYGGPLLKNLSSTTKPLQLVSGAHLRSLTGLSPSAYLDFLILLGTDASPRIPKVGPSTARKLIEAHQSIEAVLANEPAIAARLDDPEGFMEMVQSARRLFSEMPPIPEEVEAAFDGMEDEGFGQKSVEGGRKVLWEKHRVSFDVGKKWWEIEIDERGEEGEMEMLEEVEREMAEVGRRGEILDGVGVDLVMEDKAEVEDGVPIVAQRVTEKRREGGAKEGFSADEELDAWREVIGR